MDFPVALYELLFKELYELLGRAKKQWQTCSMSYLIYWIAFLCLKLHGVVGHGELLLFIGNLDELLDLTEVRLRLLALTIGPIFMSSTKWWSQNWCNFSYLGGSYLMTSHGGRLCEYARVHFEILPGTASRWCIPWFGRRSPGSGSPGTWPSCTCASGRSNPESQLTYSIELYSSNFIMRLWNFDIL